MFAQARDDGPFDGACYPIEDAVSSVGFVDFVGGSLLVFGERHVAYFLDDRSVALALLVDRKVALRIERFAHRSAHFACPILVK